MLFGVVARGAAELFAEAFGEVALAAEADEVGDFGDGAGLLAEELRGALEADRADQERRRLIGQRADLAVELRAAQADFAAETLDVEFGSLR